MFFQNFQVFDTHLYLMPLIWVMPSEFCNGFCNKKTRMMGLYGNNHNDQDDKKNTIFIVLSS